MNPTICLFLPPMWDEVYGGVNFHLSGLGWTLHVVHLDVEKTGSQGAAYAIVRSRARDGVVPILVLPVAHCALHVATEGLRVIGPAFETRDDIYVFRRTGVLRGPNGPFRIGVLEGQLTTTNLSRVILHHWCPDFYFFCSARQPDHGHSDFPITGAVHLPAGLADRRRMMVLRGDLDAAVFMGHELTEHSLFDSPDLLAAVNLNSLACSLYGVRFFPRAVFAVFEEFYRRGVDQEAVAHFVRAFNLFAARQPAEPSRHPEGARGPSDTALSSRLRQAPCPTGAASDPRAVEALIQFTNDMLDVALRGQMLRDIPTLNLARPLEEKDFIWWAEVYHARLMKRLLDSLRAAGPNVCGLADDKTGERWDACGKIVKGFCDAAETALDLPIEELKARARSQKMLRGQERGAFEKAITDQWAILTKH